MQAGKENEDRTMTRIVLSSLVCCWLLSAAEPAEAQWVRVGPGGSVTVRAPYVDVDVGPYGSTRVRAPFTAVDTPGFPGPVTVYGFPPVPYFVAPAPAQYAEADLAHMSLPELHSLLIAHWNALQQDLSGLAPGTTGASWQRYLQLPANLITGHSAASSPAGDGLVELEKVRDRYERVASSHEYRVISRLANFQATRRLLTFYVARLSEPPVEAPTIEELPLPVPAPAPPPQ
jgi:hypothetical protein